MDSAPLSSPGAVAWPAATDARSIDRRIFAARAARVAVGAVLVTGGLALPVSALAGHPTSASSILATVWAAALVAAAVAWPVARLWPLAGRLGDRWAIASFAWPLAGLALLLPLTLHSVFLLIAGDRGGVKDLNEWTALSWMIVGHCHIALAGMAVRRVERLVHGEAALSAPAIYGITVGLAMVPGAIFLLIPPVVVAVTGLPFLFLLWLPEVLLKRERASLGVTS